LRRQPSITKEPFRSWQTQDTLTVHEHVLIF
jgi:hypothetical protein